MRILRFYFSVYGRISRKAAWLAVMLPFSALGIAAGLIDAALFEKSEFEFLGTVYTPIVAVVSAIIAWPSLATSIRRFHDLNMTGWWAVLMLGWYWMPDFARFSQMPAGEKTATVAWVIAVTIGSLLGLAQLFVRGTHGPNRFGPDPTERN